MADFSGLDAPSITGAASEAARRLAPHLVTTALERSDAASRASGAPVWLKHEHQQVTGSFKPRGSLTKVTAMTAADRRRGLVAPTAGNHGIGLAYAASRLGATAHIFVPDGIDPAKVARLTALGAAVRKFPDMEEARLSAMTAAAEHGWTFASAYNDPDMIVGAATLGLELAVEMDGVDAVIVPIGGGGLAAGVAAALATTHPHVQVWAAATAASPTWVRWYSAGSAVPVELEASIAEGMSGPVESSTITLDLVNRFVAGVVPVTERQIRASVRWLATEHQQMVEPSGAAALAVALARPAELLGLSLCVVLTGRNVGLERFRGLLDATE